MEGRHGGLINCFFEFFDTYTKLGCSFPCGPCLANQVVNCLTKGGAKLLVSSEVDFYSPNQKIIGLFLDLFISSQSVQLVLFLCVEFHFFSFFIIKFFILLKDVLSFFLFNRNASLLFLIKNRFESHQGKENEKKCYL